MRRIFLISFFIPVLYTLARILLAGAAVLFLVDYIFLFVFGRSPSVRRVMQERLSNGDENHILVRIHNRMPFSIHMEILDELPEQLQERHFILQRRLQANEKADVPYLIRPTERGVMLLEGCFVYVRSLLGLACRRFTTDAEKEVAVYPSFMHFRKYQLAAEAAQVNEQGARKVRKIGQSMEFEQIKEYVTGDDIRTINWKATARKGGLMVNSFMEEKSQQVYCLVDKGRLMKMPFQGLSLLDYAINSTLVMTDGRMPAETRQGGAVDLFRPDGEPWWRADRKPVQREKIMQVLYKQQTAFLESDFEMLYMQVRAKIKQRSLLILYTNFESLNSLRRQLPYLRSMAMGKPPAPGRFL